MSSLSDRSTERGLLLAHLGAWRIAEIKEFMIRHNIAGRAGTKPELLERVEDALRTVDVSNVDLTTYLDELEPGNKQHVILLAAAEAAGEEWGSAEHVQTKLRAAGLEDRWQRTVPLVAPDDLEVSSVSLDQDGVLEVYAVNRRLHLSRREDLDRDDVDRGGINIVEHAYEKIYIRAWCRLRWNTVAGTAALHVSQLPSQQLYSDVQVAFWDRVNSFLPQRTFTSIDLSRAVSQLHELEKDSPPGEARLQAVQYVSHGQRRAQFSSVSGSQSLLNENAAMDTSMETWRSNGRGAGGNFYFLPGSTTSRPGNPLVSEVHVHILVKDSRVNFPLPNEPGDLDYVLSRIRALAR